MAVPAIAPPEWLNDDGLRVWNRLAPRLALMRILQAIDGDTFARYCQDFGRWVKLQKNIDELGETYPAQTAHGNYIKANPAVMLALRLNRDLMLMESNFALNPADRQRLFAARAAAAGVGAGGADLFDSPSGDGDGAASGGEGGGKKSPVGFLN